MSANDPQVNFRMPLALRDKLKASADDNNRTLTSEIVARLEASFAAPEVPRGTSFAPPEIVQALLKQDFLEAMAEKLVKASDGLRFSDRAVGHYTPPEEEKPPKPRAKKPTK